MPCRVLISAALLLASACVLSTRHAFCRDTSEVYKECYEGGLPDKVIAACSLVIEGSGTDSTELATALKNRADAYDDKHRHDLALEDFNRAATLNPADPYVFNNRGTTLVALGLYTEAIKDFDRALELRPGLAMALSNRCFAQANASHLDEALADCNAALRLAPQSSGAKAARAFVFLKLKQPEDAVRDYDAVLAQREDPYCLFGRAVAKRMAGHLRESDDDVVRALAIKADIAEHMARLGIRLQDVRSVLP